MLTTLPAPVPERDWLEALRALLLEIEASLDLATLHERVLDMRLSVDRRIEAQQRREVAP